MNVVNRKRPWSWKIVSGKEYDDPIIFITDADGDTMVVMDSRTWELDGDRDELVARADMICEAVNARGADETTK